MDVEQDDYVVPNKRGKILKKVCLAENFVAGNCYKEIGGVNGYEVADCSNADFKVTDVQETADFECLTEGSAMKYAYTDPPRTYCIDAPK